MDERQAREVLMVQAVETVLGADHRDWTRDDRAWAQRTALQAVGADAPAETYVSRRARAVIERLGGRWAPLSRWLGRRVWHRRWIAAIVLAGLVAGLLADGLGSGQQVNLLAPAVWGVLAWNLGVYAAVAVGALLRPRGRARRGWLLRAADAARDAWRGHAGGEAGPRAVLQAWGAAWMRHGAPLRNARAGLLLHAGAASLALGLIAGMYLRGLVLDYQASWQSTFLQAPQVHAILRTALAPALALTGQSLPDVAGIAALRAPAGSASAAPWIHLLAATLALGVVLPRMLLALAAAWRARRLARHVSLPLQDDPYFVRLLQEQRGGRTRVHVQPHARAPSASAALGLRTVLAELYGDAVTVDVGATTPYGEEDRAPAPAGRDGPVLALFDLTATPEAEAQGRFLERLGGEAVAVIDEAAFRRRFGTADDRIEQRRQAWRQLAALNRRPPLFVDLDAPDLRAAADGLRRSLGLG